MNPTRPHGSRSRLSFARALITLAGGVAALALPACTHEAPVVARDPFPAHAGDEQPAAKATAKGEFVPMQSNSAAQAPAWVHAAAANALSMRAVPDTIPAGSDALANHIPAENPDAVMVDGMEGLAQLTFAQEGSDFDPCISRDGKWLVYASTQHRPTPDIYLKQVGSRTVTQLTADPSSDVMPSLSPDSSRVAFCSNRNGWWNLYVMSASGGQAVQLSTTNAHDLHPSWSSDGKRLVFCRLGQMSGRWELWVMDVSQPQVAEFIGYGMFPQWSPVAGNGADGADKILFQRGRERGDRAFSLWTIEYKPGSAGNPTEIITTRGSAAINASWSPDGQWIVYSTVQAAPAEGQAARPAADLWLTGADGSGRVNLTGGKFSNLMPVWGADNRIYFVSDRNGLDQVWSIATDKALAAAGASNRGMGGMAAGKKDAHHDGGHEKHSETAAAPEGE